jgi:hypothetical protein
MPTYNFRHEAEVYVVSGGTTHRIHVTDISFSQTFSEESYPVNTIHSPNDLFEASVINKASAANFSFSMPAIVQADYTIVETLLLGATEFELYVKTANTDTFRLEKAVMTNGSFVIERSRPLSLTISGEASRLYKGASLTGTSAISNRSFTIPKVDVTLDDSLLTDVISVNLELQNEIEWNPFATVNDAVSATTMYPSGFTLSKKILAGSITQYLTGENSSNALTFNTSSTLSIKAGNGLPNNQFRGFSFGPATCSFTNRIATGTVYTQNYDWRLTDNTTSLTSLLNYVTD